jgi:hypothetical protein
MLWEWSAEMKARLTLATIAVLSIAACANRVDLRPKAGQSMPVAPAGAAATPTVDELIEPEPQARPGRSDDPLTRSEERQDDPFDLPPPG